MEDRCILCGAIIPEGGHTCWNCRTSKGYSGAYDHGEDMLPRWQMEVTIDERLSQEKDLLIRKVKALPTYGRMYKDKYDRLVKISDVVEAIESN